MSAASMAGAMTRFQSASKSMLRPSADFFPKGIATKHNGLGTSIPPVRFAAVAFDVFHTQPRRAVVCLQLEFRVDYSTTVGAYDFVYEPCLVDWIHVCRHLQRSKHEWWSTRSTVRKDLNVSFSP